MKKPDCPEVRHKRAGDESYDVCDIKGRFCAVEHGGECEHYKEYLKELEDEVC